MSLNFRYKRPVGDIDSSLFPGSLEYGFKTSDIVGDIPLADSGTSELPVKDSMGYARHCWRKGSLEFMGGPTMFSQGHGVEDYLNQDRGQENMAPLNIGEDEMGRQLNVDTPEN